MTWAEQNALKIKAWLDAHGPFVGPQRLLAREVGIPYERLVEALHWLRRPANVAANGWTIPFQKAGRGHHVYAVVDNLSAFTINDDALVARSTVGRRQTIQTWLLRTVAQEQLAATATAGADKREHERIARVLDGAAAMVSA